MSLQPVTPINPQPRIPILLHLRTPINFQPRTPLILQPRTPNAPFVTRFWSVKRGTPPQSEVQKETNSSDIQPQNQSSVQVQVKTPPEEQTRPQDQKETSGSARTLHYVKVQGVTRPLSESHPPPELSARPKPPQATSKQIQPPSQSRGLKTQSQSQISTQSRSHGSTQRPEKRRKVLEAGSSAKRSSSCGLEPVVAPSTKPWPVFTIAGSPPAQTAKTPPEVDRYSTDPKNLLSFNNLQLFSS